MFRWVKGEKEESNEDELVGDEIGWRGYYAREKVRFGWAGVKRGEWRNLVDTGLWGDERDVGGGGRCARHLTA